MKKIKILPNIEVECSDKIQNKLDEIFGPQQQRKVVIIGGEKIIGSLNYLMSEKAKKEELIVIGDTNSNPDFSDVPFKITNPYGKKGMQLKIPETRRERRERERKALKKKST